MTARPDPLLGTDLGPYRIESVIGRGGMGVVYLAEERRLGRRVALKLLAPDFADDEAFRARFLRESHLAAAIDHANIIPIYEAGEVDGTYYIAMRYVEGTDLEARLGDGPLDPGLVISLLAQVAGALDAAHVQGLVHRDVKPANLLLADEGGDVPHVYLTDFGLTRKRSSQSGLTRAGSTLGTLEYMAPEQVEGREVDAPADEYALACAAFRCLTGHVPFERESDIATAMAHLRDEPPSATALRPELPAAVDAVLARGMAKDPARRYETCGSLVADLEAAVGGAKVATRRGAGTAQAVGSWRRTVALAGAGAVGLALVAGLVVAAGIVGRASPAPPTQEPAASVGAIATPPPSTSTAPSPDPSIYPNTREQAVLGLLPAALAATCQRGQGKADLAAAGITGQIVLSRSGDPPKPNYGPILPRLAPPASLACAPAGGPDAVYVDELAVDPSYSDSGQEASTAVADVATRYAIPKGDCRIVQPAATTWSNGGSAVASGNVVCVARAARDGAAWMYWSFGGGKELGIATRKDGDYAALYAWWKQLVLFLK